MGVRRGCFAKTQEAARRSGCRPGRDDTLQSASGRKGRQNVEPFTPSLRGWAEQGMGVRWGCFAKTHEAARRSGFRPGRDGPFESASGTKGLGEPEKRGESCWCRMTRIRLQRKRVG